MCVRCFELNFGEGFPRHLLRRMTDVTTFDQELFVKVGSCKILKTRYCTVYVYSIQDQGQRKVKSWFLDDTFDAFAHPLFSRF